MHHEHTAQIIIGGGELEKKRLLLNMFLSQKHSDLMAFAM